MSCAVTDPNALPVSPVSNVKIKPRLADAAREFLSLVQLARFAFSALLLKLIELAQSGRRDFVRLFVGRR